MSEREQTSGISRWLSAEPEWELFQDNAAIWNAVFEQCDAAKHSIDMEQYIFASQGVGRRLLDLLASKAAQGVAVRILADGLGSLGLAQSEGGRALIRNGGRIVMFNGVAGILRSPMKRLHRLHRKTLVCDGTNYMIGGSCYHDRMANWRDTMILVRGPLPPMIMSEFERLWRYAQHLSQDPLLRAGDAATDRGWSFAMSGPSVHTPFDLRRILPERIAGASRSVSLTTPYLVPDRSLWRAFLTAAERGVAVRLLIPKKSDYRILDLIGHRFAHALRRRGVEVRAYAPGMVHAKVALVDGNWSCVSSFNLDVFSAKLNLESGVISTSDALYHALSAQMDVDLARSDPL